MIGMPRISQAFFNRLVPAVFNAEFKHPTGVIVRHDDRHRPLSERFDEHL